MSDKTQIENYYKAGGTKVIFVLDKVGKITAQNTESKKIFGGVVQRDFFELFEPRHVALLEKAFTETVQNDTPSKEVVDITYEYETNTYDIAFYPLKGETHLYIIAELSRLEFKLDEERTKKFWISTEELEKTITDKKLLEIINTIKTSFPFSFIEKSKLQKDINQLDNYFWIKEPGGKIILANESYANALGTKSSRMEGNLENEFLPKHLLRLFRTVDNYIVETSNVVLVEGLSSQLISGLAKGLEFVFSPILDIDRNPVAVIGLSQIKRSAGFSIRLDEFTTAAIKNLDTPFLLVDNQDKILAYTNAVNKILGIEKSVDLRNYKIEAVIDKELFESYNKYKNDEQQKNPIEFNYVIVGAEKLKVKVRIEKIFDPDGNLIGIRFELISQYKEQEVLESKAKMYDVLLQSIPEAMFVYDVDNLKFLEVNNAALNLYGYKREEFLNMDLTDLYAPEDIQTLLTTEERKGRSGDYLGPWKHKRRDGTSILVQLNRTNIEYKGKNAHLNIVRNVTEELEQRKKLQLLQPFIENSSDIIITTDKDGIVLSANESFTKKIGYPKRELEKKSFLTLVSDNDRSRVNKDIFRTKINTPQTLNIDLKRARGEFIKANITSIPVVDFEGNIESFNIIIKPEEDAKKDQKQTYVDSQSKIDPPFLSNVFHELLTPINVIIGFVQELSESIKEPNEEQKEAIDIIRENQKLLLQIMDNAVDYSALEQRSVKLETELINFTSILEELKEHTKKTFESRQIELNYGKISSSLIFESDRQKIISLLTLYLKFASLITKEKSIYLSAYNISEEKCAIAIRDSKTQISQYLLKALNEIFTQDENSIRRNYGFSRFSVKLANKLIDILSVEKEVISREGEPFEFAFVLPIRFKAKESIQIEIKQVEKQPARKEEVVRAAETIEKPVEKIEKIEAVKKPEKKYLELSQLSCLYLEDQLDSQILFKVQMKDLKNLEFADSFESALPLLKTKKFDFIVIDINLKGEYNGLDALKIIQKMPGYTNVPIIASTAYLLPGDKENFVTAGFKDFIPKPLLRDKILEVLKKIFDLKV